MWRWYECGYTKMFLRLPKVSVSNELSRSSRGRNVRVTSIRSKEVRSQKFDSDRNLLSIANILHCKTIWKTFWMLRRILCLIMTPGHSRGADQLRPVVKHIRKSLMLITVRMLWLIPCLDQLLSVFVIFIARLVRNYFDLRIQTLLVKNIQVIETALPCYRMLQPI